MPRSTQRCALWAGCSVSDIGLNAYLRARNRSEDFLGISPLLSLLDLAQYECIEILFFEEHGLYLIRMCLIRHKIHYNPYFGLGVPVKPDTNLLNDTAIKLYIPADTPCKP